MNGPGDRADAALAHGALAVRRKSLRQRFPLRTTGISAALVLADVVVLLVVTWLAIWLRRIIPFFAVGDNFNVILYEVGLLTCVVWVVAIAIFDGYSAKLLVHGFEIYRSVFNASLLAGGGIGVVCYLASFELSRAFYVALLIIVPPALMLVRLCARAFLHRMHRAGRGLSRVMLVGEPGAVKEIALTLQRNDWLGYDVIGYLNPYVDSDNPEGCEALAGVPCLGSAHSLSVALADYDPQILLFTEGATESTISFRRTAWELEDQGIDVVVVPAMTEISSDRVELRPVAGLPLMHLELPRTIEAGRWTKRAFDVVVASGILLVLSPLLLVIALVIKLGDGGPVLFKQTRVGRDGEEFGCFKFRSMVPDAEERLAELAKEAQDKGNLVMFKMADDPRITKAGKFLRRFSLDEFPQLINVLRGEMSLVGPRPALPKEVALYDDIARRRLSVRPGMTGLWQVSGRSDLSWEETVRLDLYYVDNWSFVRDLGILAQTANAMVSSRGAY
ncbi:sugar transferase [Dermabacteraceae bacterium P13088]